MLKKGKVRGKILEISQNLKRIFEFKKFQKPQKKAPQTYLFSDCLIATICAFVDAVDEKLRLTALTISLEFSFVALARPSLPNFFLRFSFCDFCLHLFHLLFVTKLLVESVYVKFARNQVFNLLRRRVNFVKEILRVLIVIILTFHFSFVVQKVLVCFRGLVIASFAN